MSSEGPEKKSDYVVIVNDNLTQLRYLSNLLERQGHQVVTFQSAEQALTEMIRECPPELIITDLHMPGIDGWRFCRLLRSPEYNAFNEIPILVISATFVGAEPLRITRESGANAFLSAPVNADSLLNEVQSLLDGAQPKHKPHVLIVEDSKTQASYLQNAFHSWEYTSHTVSTVDDAIALLKMMPFDAAVIDYHLPGKKGDELLPYLSKTHPDAISIMMTTDPNPELAVIWMKKGASAYVRKPFDPIYLVELISKSRREKTLLFVEHLLEQRTKELQQSEANLEEARKIGQLGRWELDLTTYQLLWSDTLFDLFEIDPAKFKASYDAYLETIHPEDRERVDHAYRASVMNKTPYNLTHRLVTSCGKLKWVTSTGYTEYDRDGLAIRSVGIIQDITDLRRAEEALRENEKKYRTILQTAMDGFCMMDSKGSIIEVNDAYCRMTGYAENELLKMKITDLAGSDTLKEIADRLEKIFAHGEDRFESRQRTKSGDLIDIEASIQYRPNNGGQFVGFLRDITEIKKADLDKARLEEQLRQAQKMESVGRLAGGVAHDFNNMLMAITGYAEMSMEEVKQGSSLHENLIEIQKAADRSADLARQLLAFARKQTIDPKVLNLNDTVGGMLKMLRRLIGEDVNLTWKPGADLWPVKIDPAQIDQILANLVVNARDAIEGVGKVAIETNNNQIREDFAAGNVGFIPGSYVCIAVTDSGCGMDNETLSHIFEPFFTTKAVGEGTGLGLATVYGIVKQNDGFINVVSQPGRGTTFNIYIPRHQGESAESVEPTRKKYVVGGKETILLVEDEHLILELGKAMLKKLGYNVLSARTPSEAIQLASLNPGDIRLLITDVVMPEMNGRELAMEVLKLNPKIKCIYMSGYTSDVIAHHGVLDDGVAFIQKPYSVKDLAGKVREVLEQKN